ncbi:MAG: DUF1800 domain-containing protein [Rhodothermaceae bacterium]|nr:DUF1800 domain-containing protein [Rhodothermaceae bacterium]
MDRRAFLRRAARPAAPSLTLTGPGQALADPDFEYLPGRFVDPRLPIDWAHRAARPDPNAPPRTGEALRTGGGLASYVPSAEAPWDAARARHLLRRTGLAPTVAETDTVLGSTPQAAVDAIVDAALSAPLPPTPAWYDAAFPDPNATDQEIQEYIDNNVGWLYAYKHEINRDLLVWRVAGTGLRERLALFWHNHFVTALDSYFHAPWLARYWGLLRTHALGDLQPFVHAMGLSPAMLIYLNGIENRIGAPNENYARELLELFTMGITDPNGQPNYTQTDIEELARALTGWTIDVYGTQEAYFVAPWHDAGEKTILGQTGNWSYDDIVPILFGQRPTEIAHFVCRELYQEFVYPIPNEAVVAEMAALLVANDFVVEPVVRTLLKSVHFFDAATIGARVKSPVELFYGVTKALGFQEEGELLNILNYFTDTTGQIVLDPPNVSGWDGHRAWIDTGTLAFRWLYCEWLLYQQATLQPLAMTMPAPFDAAALTADLASYLTSVPLNQEEVDRLVEVLLDGLPSYEWNPFDPGAEGRLFGLVLALLRLPEAQLA